jgi:hypothetical protein
MNSHEITDIVAERLRTHFNGAMRPLWADLPDHWKCTWRDDARRFERALARVGLQITEIPDAEKGRNDEQ